MSAAFLIELKSSESTRRQPVPLLELYVDRRRWRRVRDNRCGSMRSATYYRDRSLWLDALDEPLTARPPLGGDCDCDVAIVGAGFTGLWAAYYLKQLDPRLRIVVVEREIAGFGASGRNGGWASGGIAGSARAYGERPGSDAIRRATRETHAAVDEIGRVAAAEGIDCGYRKAGILSVATTEPQRSRLERVVTGSELSGGEERLVSSAELAALARIPGVIAAAHSPHGARIDPGRLARGLALACERHGVVIHERTEALDFGPGSVRCATGAVRAGAVLGATEAYTTQLPNRRLRYLPLYSLMVATEPLADSVWAELGWRDGLLIRDLRHLFFYAQRTADGRIAIGGRGAPYRLRDPISEHNERVSGVAERLTQTIRRHFPAAAGARVTHHWGGPLAVPRDWSMSVRFDRATRVGWAGGYSGHGVVAANIAGRTLAELVLGEASDRVTLPWVQHASRDWEPEPLRFLASRTIVGMLGAADRIEDRTGQPAGRVRLIAPFMPPA
jgi:glycine/D-amino acid oxidase-like deaminating enzyme